MTCPVCKRELAPTLSICLTCGAMINDTVREELETKISRAGEPAKANSGRLSSQPKLMMEEPSRPAIDSHAAPRLEPPAKRVIEPPAKRVIEPPAKRVIEPPARSAVEPPARAALEPQLKTETPKPVAPAPIATPSKPIAARFETGNLHAKKTSPTLVEFQTKKATVPEWRLQLQNSVRQKVGPNRREDDGAETSKSQSAPRSTNGANALKVEFVENDEPARHQNPKVANALKRIEESRRTFSNQPVPEQPLQAGKQPAARNYPFNVVARSNERPPKSAGQKASINPSPKPMLVSPLKIEKRGFDTNKLPPLAQTPAAPRSFIPSAEPPSSKQDTLKARLDLDAIENEVLELEPETDEIDDLAPISMRFSAGIFDMIIGVFASLILLSPFILSGGDWFSLSGFFAVSAAAAIVLFLYLTITLAFVGRTLGMRLFSLELVDVEENAYPTLHQAAVSSAVFLLSMAFAGIGFLPMLFNEERRAAHDILSGTILIREY